MGAAVMDIWSCVERIICHDIRIVRCGVYARVYRIITTAVYRGTAVYYQHHRKPVVYANTIRTTKLATRKYRYSHRFRDARLGDDCDTSVYAMGDICTDSIFVMGVFRYSVAINSYFYESIRLYELLAT